MSVLRFEQQFTMAQTHWEMAAWVGGCALAVVADADAVATAGTRAGVKEVDWPCGSVMKGNF